MKVEFRYLNPVNLQKSSSYYVIELYLDDGKHWYPFHYNNLLNDQFAWINSLNLLSEEYLKNNNIEYIFEAETNELIPIGLVDFTNNTGNSVLPIFTDSKSSLYKFDQVINNIIKAIKIKYKSVEFEEKFKHKLTDIKEI